MKVMEIVYSQECDESQWDGSGSRSYMGEKSWTVGEPFSGKFIQGKVTEFRDDGDGMIDMWVTVAENKIALAISFPYHAVQRIYYGGE